MLTVMVVDDDPLLCTAMRRKIEMIDRESQLGIQETLIAHSAQEAWEILQIKPIDVLISDIRMPYQSGLELVDKVNKAFPGIQLVILSGYDDYEYMRGALRSGVVDYLLKPVKLVQIQEVLLKCQENLRCREEQSTRKDNGQETLENWLNGLLVGRTGKPPVEFPHPVFWVAWTFGGEGEFVSQAAEVFAGEQREDVTAYFSRSGSQDSVVLFNTKSSREDVVETYIKTCQKSCARQGVGRLCFAVSRPFTRLEEYPMFYKEARYTMAYRMLVPFSLRFSSAQPVMGQSRLPRFQSRIHTAFQSRNFVEIYQWLQKIFCRDFFQEQPFPQEIRSFYVYWESQIQEMASAFHLELESFPHFSRFPSLDGMQEYLHGVLKQVEEAVQASTNKYAYILSTAKQYVEKNYNRNISMNEVAEMCSMSYSYFSRVFKEQLHQSFSEYVLSVRMREAKRLMEEDPAIKIKEVAALVGYESVYAFSRAYKQYYHVSPKQDRDG